jgi:MFS family permease
VLDLTLFASASFRTANAAGLVFFAGFAALGLNNVLFLRQVWGWSVLRAGLVSALAPATVALLAPFAGKLAARIGFRPLVATGPVIVATAMLTYLIVLDERPSMWTIILIGEVAAVGIAAFIPVNSAAAVASLPPARFSVGGAVNNTARQVGSVLGIALLVAAIGSPASPAELLDAHRRGFALIAVTMLVAAAISVRQTQGSRTAVDRPDAPLTTATVR